jgi:crossover junction endodeoxyribonuclease RusA
MSKKGHALIVEDCAKTKPWTEAVKWAILETLPGLHLSGPLAVTIHFTLPKPKSAPKRRRTYPDRKPDIDKLMRSTLDALTASGLIEDDARIISIAAGKFYPNEDSMGMESPGARIFVSEVG